MPSSAPVHVDPALKSVLLVEDNDVLRANYVQLLTAHGLSVEAVNNRKAAMAAFEKAVFDVIVLDVTLGGDFDAGFELCLAFRSKRKDVPIIFLTERDDIADRISGLRLGADDYLSKTTSSVYLAARINALIRRMEALRADLPAVEEPVESASNLIIDDRISRAYWRSKPLELSLTQFWIVRELSRNDGRVRSISDLMKAANITVQPNTIVVHIKSIRDEFIRLDPTFNSIKSERARGYRWVEDSE